LNNSIIELACSNTLNNEHFQQDYIQLTKSELTNYTEVLTIDQVEKLLQTASLFALSERETFRKIAYKIVVYLLNGPYSTEYPSLPLAYEVIFCRLGCLPAIKAMVKINKAKDYFGYYPEFNLDKSTNNLDTFSTYLKFPEVISKKVTNQVQISDKKTLTFTDSQATVYLLLKEKPSVAFSAPTSAGKSYVIYNYIAETLEKSPRFCAVYVVPTKALIAEIQQDITNAILELGVKPKDFAVLNSLSTINKTRAFTTSKIVLVLTQERLLDAMANNQLTFVNILVVDEAQKISDPKRGVLIEDAVEELVEKNPTMKTVFISPFIKDPYRFKKIFNLQNDLSYLITAQSPVAQNFIRVNFNKKDINTAVVTNDPNLPSRLKEIPTGNYKSNVSVSSGIKRKAWVTTNIVPKDEPTIVYCDIPSDCRKVAALIASEMPKQQMSKELITAQNFFKEHVHEDYYLCDALQNRIGYHYGKMPQFVKYYVKQLFGKQITILCCTSTLLEGVNMPAKNIVLNNPKAGRTQDMDRLSILNLAGRAGRLLKDYYGKVYCINLDEWDVKDLLEEKLEGVESSVETSLTKNMDLLIEYLKDEQKFSAAGIENLATSLIVKQLKDPESKFLENFIARKTELSPEKIEEIKHLLRSISNKINPLNKEVIYKNRTLDPRLQFNLYQFLNAKETKDIVTAPLPDDEEFTKKLREIFQSIAIYLFKQQNGSYRYFSGLARRWIKETTYKQLIMQKIAYNLRKENYKGNTPAQYKAFVNKMIEDLDSELETNIKYEYSRGLKCYMDITAQILRERGETREVCQELATYLEAGACNKNVLLLLELLLSRSTAIQVNEFLPDGLETIEQCLENIRNQKNAIQESLSPVLYREVEELLERYKLLE
jgi:hypothetical protein